MIENFVFYKKGSNIRSLFFGIPLEDLFPQDDLHQSIKLLFYQAYENATRHKRYFIEDIISSHQGSLDERLLLKQKVILHLPLPQNSSPGALIWLLRHFIGLLPLPLLPRYYDMAKFNWETLADDCKNSMKNKREREPKETQLLFEKIINYVLKLPLQYWLLFFTLLDFLRKLSVFPRKEPNVNVDAVTSLTRYFANAIFCRPYRPGFVSKKDKRYIPLLMFLILNWRNAKNYISRTKISSNPMMKHEDVEDSLYNIYDYPQSNTFKCTNKNSCQTEIKLGRVLKFSEFETKTVHKRIECCCCCCGSHYEKYTKKYVCKKKMCCCMYSSNYTRQSEEESKVKRKSTFLEDLEYSLKVNDDDDTRNAKDTNSNTSYLYPNLNNLNDKTEYRRWSSFIHSPNFFKNDQYIYDDYSDQCQQIGFNLNLKNIDGDNNDNNNVENPDTPHSPENKELTERVSKIGWSYLCPNVNNSFLSDDSLPSSPKIGWNIPKNHYTIYFDSKEVLDEDDKDLCENTNSSSDNILSSPERAADFYSDDAKSGASFVKFDKIRSKLEFMKLLNLRKIKPRKTTSFENLHSNIKYKKMNSTRSTIF